MINIINSRKYAALWTQGYALLVLGSAISGCASTGAPSATPAERSSQLAKAPEAQFPRIALEAGKFETLGDTIRHIGETYGGGVALVAGLEERPAPTTAIAQTGFVAGMEKIAAGYGCKLQTTPYYVFIYPDGYESLEALTIQGKLDPQFDSVRASFAIGAGTDVFNALALLGNTLNVTIIADNAVADAWCGEMFLENAPLSVILEALLKSARVSPAAIAVESGDHYVFIQSTANTTPRSNCLNADGLSDADRALLEREVVIRLPDASAQTTFQPGPSTLAEVLPILSSQIGLPVTADSEMAQLPINSAVFQGVTLQNALDLIVRQWLVPNYGFRVEAGSIHFCERPT